MTRRNWLSVFFLLFLILWGVNKFMELGCRNKGYDSCRAEKSAQAATEATEKKVQAAKEAESLRNAAREAACRKRRYTSCQAQRAAERRVAAREAGCRERGYKSCGEEAIDMAEAACRARGFESCAAEREDKREAQRIESYFMCALFHYEIDDLKECIRKRMRERGFSMQ